MTKREKEERKEVIRLYKKLINANSHNFPEEGESLEAPCEKGVYIILSPKNKVLRVGSTGAQGGIRRRLRYHMSGNSEFIYNYVEGDGKWLRGRCKFKYIEEEDDEIRAYLKAYATVDLWPEYIDVD